MYLTSILTGSEGSRMLRLSTIIHNIIIDLQVYFNHEDECIRMDVRAKARNKGVTVLCTIVFSNQWYV